MYPIKCDLTKETEILDMFDEIKSQFGGVDVCINNAALFLMHDSELMTGKTENWRKMLDVGDLRETSKR